jgi:signal transduction histidine kinase/ActR/RegA family two-component response regulator
MGAVHWQLPRSIVLALSVALITLLFTTYRSLSETRALLGDTTSVVHTHEVRERLDDLALTIGNAETAQRAFLLTGDDQYLNRYNAAATKIGPALAHLAQLAADNPRQLVRVAELQRHVRARLEELAHGLAVRREQGLDAARATLLADSGRRTMEDIRGVVSDMRAEEGALRTDASRQAADVFRRAVVSEAITAVAGVALLLAIGLIVNTRLAERQRATQEIAAQRERADAARVEAERVNVLKDEFLAVLSHELRTPLNAVLGWTQMLRAGTLKGPTIARAVAAIDRNAAAQHRLVEDLLDVSRIVTGKFNLDMKPMPLAPCVKAAVDAIAPAAVERGVALTSRYSADPIINGDVDRVQQVASNLLSNALKFTPPGGHMHVSLSGEDGRAILIVRDTGCGIDGDLLPFIFDRFRQGDGSSTRAHRGLGLGLAIVRHIVEQHGATVQASSEGADRGTTMSVIWPALALDASATAADTPSHEVEQPLRDVVVLLVDDDADSREVGAYVLGQHGAAVTTAGSGLEAIARLAAFEPDVVVTDIQMPELDGFALIRRIAADAAAKGIAACPVIALTAHARAEDSAAASAAGFAAFVTKPIQVQTLVTAVASAARRHPVGGSS